jgi:hypothetical protein
VRDWKPRVLPLPGGPRYAKWAIASPSGFTTTPLFVGPTVGFDTFVIKNSAEMRGYFVPLVGVGISVGIPKLKPILGGLQTLLTGFSYSAMKFKDVTPRHAMTWQEMEACLVTVTGGNIGAVKNIDSFAHIKFHAPGVQQYGPSSVPINVAETAFEFDSGSDWGGGINVDVVNGVLIKIGSA